MAYAFWFHDHLQQRTFAHLGELLRVSSQQQSLNRVLLLGSIWSSYIIRAIIGGYTERHWDLQSVVGSLYALSALIMVDLIWPITPSES